MRTNTVLTGAAALLLVGSSAATGLLSCIKCPDGYTSGAAPAAWSTLTPDERYRAEMRAGCPPCVPVVHESSNAPLADATALVTHEQDHATVVVTATDAPTTSTVSIEASSSNSPFMLSVQQGPVATEAAAVPLKTVAHVDWKPKWMPKWMPTKEEQEWAHEVQEVRYAVEDERAEKKKYEKAKKKAEKEKQKTEKAAAEDERKSKHKAMEKLKERGEKRKYENAVKKAEEKVKTTEKTAKHKMKSQHKAIELEKAQVKADRKEKVAQR